MVPQERVRVFWFHQRGGVIRTNCSASNTCRANVKNGSVEATYDYYLMDRNSSQTVRSVAIIEDPHKPVQLRSKTGGGEQVRSNVEEAEKFSELSEEVFSAEQSASVEELEGIEE